MVGPWWYVALLRTGLGLRGQRIRGVLSSKLLTQTFALVLASSPFHATLLRAACDAVGARQIGGAEMEGNRKVSCLVTGPNPSSTLSYL